MADQQPTNRKPTPRRAQNAQATDTGKFIAIAACVAIALVIGFGVFFSMKGPNPNSASKNAEHVSGQSAELHASQSAVPAASSPAQPSTAPQPASSGSADSLAWRDADFAVDPNRTDWNFSGEDEKVFYLTIDDGPSDKTQQVLDILDKYGCKATFFVTGHDPDHYHMIKEAYDRGHTIGLHTMSHDYATVYSSVDAYFADLSEIGNVVEEQIGYVPCFIRFPGGSSNAISANYTQGIMTTLADAVQQRGYQYYDWNISSGDGSEHTTEEIIGYATEGTEYQNIVFLCHDSSPKQTTVDALPAIIEHYQSKGYTFKALDRSSYVCHHGVNN